MKFGVFMCLRHLSIHTVLFLARICYKTIVLVSNRKYVFLNVKNGELYEMNQYFIK